jgi:hypothetical protein
MTGGTAMTKNTMTKNTMTKVIWTLDDEGRLTARWDVPTAKAAAPASPRLMFRTMTQVVAAPGRVSRAAALAAYYRLQTALARRSAA